MSKYLDEYSFRLILTKPRQLRLGSFRTSGRSGLPEIRINNDLGPYSFLLVFLHELAHLVTWRKEGRKASPHGREWKSVFYELTLPLLQEPLLPAELIHALKKYFIRTPASFNRDSGLYKLLNNLEKNEAVVFLEDLEENRSFKLINGKRMIKLHRIRTRYKCFCQSDRKYYLVSPVAQIFPVEDKG